jgi:hypothetical protein
MVSKKDYSLLSSTVTFFRLFPVFFGIESHPISVHLLAVRKEK